MAKPDLITSNYDSKTSTSTTSIYLNDGNGQFAKPMTLAGSLDYDSPVDVNGDGKPDLMTYLMTYESKTNANTFTTSIYLNDGKGQFASPITVSGSYCSTVDLNGDGTVSTVFKDGQALNFYTSLSQENSATDNHIPTGDIAITGALKVGSVLSLKTPCKMKMA
jgi:hypothetical protein